MKELRKGPLQSTPWINCLERDSRITVKSFYFHKTGKAKTRFYRIYFSDFHHILVPKIDLSYIWMICTMGYILPVGPIFDPMGLNLDKIQRVLIKTV